MMTARRRASVGAVTVPVPRISSSVTPETNERYPGIRGSTQGEMNDKTPAMNAANSVTFSIIRRV